MDRRKKITAAVATILLLSGFFAVTPLRQATADFLSRFRVQRMETVKITPEQLQQMGQAMQSQSGEINLQQFGKADVIQKPEQKKISLAEARNQLPFKIRQPAYLPLNTGLAEPVDMHQEGTAEFQLNVPQVNQLLQSLGSKTLLPQDLSGKAFRIRIPPGLRTEYIQPDGRKVFTLNQFDSPEVTVPEGVDANALRSALLDLPILPTELRTQLSAIGDWKNTMIVPYAEDRMEKVTINGVEGLYAQNLHMGRSFLFWVDKGVLYQLDGSLDKGEALKVAQSLK
ncbi:DUF4367 domain-containing protein [Heliobacterium chlorum]|uniref:DUF4367 domain-containing protein n=1 Tax=Heliobacterium chlorum TaxID=2698 RepID=A0ABR7SYL9_HELCL|nr:DUF4367 domain-containing protein [Heliobacterium chlorum]MBC9783633.1 DUF4367 domain-containing protein [Heliobacterium chlorum]